MTNIMTGMKMRQIYTSPYPIKKSQKFPHLMNTKIPYQNRNKFKQYRYTNLFPISNPKHRYFKF